MAQILRVLPSSLLRLESSSDAPSKVTGRFNSNSNSSAWAMCICAWLLKNPLSPPCPRLVAVSTTNLAYVINGMLRSPVRLKQYGGVHCDCRIVGADLQMNQVMLTPVMLGHRRERFPIHAFFINAQSAPSRFVLKNLMGELIDAGTGFAGAGVAGDEPAATELIAPPSQTPKSGDMAFAPARKNKSQDGNECPTKRRQYPRTIVEFSAQESDLMEALVGLKRNELEFHGQALPMR